MVLEVVLLNLCSGEMENRIVDEDYEHDRQRSKVKAEDTKAKHPVFKFKYDRIPIKLAFPDTSAADERYGGSGDVVILEGELIRPRGVVSKTVTIFMHPSGIQVICDFNCS